MSIIFEVQNMSISVLGKVFTVEIQKLIAVLTILVNAVQNSSKFNI